MSDAAAVGEEDVADGRRLRRNRNRDAVVDAYLELVREGDLHPSLAAVAERSGVSHRSVFRYFADKDELTRAAIERQAAFARALAALDVAPDAPLGERIEAFVRQRAEVCEAIGNVGRLSRSLAVHRPIVEEQLARSRRIFRAQARTLFAPELGAMDTAAAAETLAAVDVICSFEAYDLLRRDEGMSQARAARTMHRAVTQLLS